MPYNGDGNLGHFHYTLADGVEGQMMYLVPASSFDGSVFPEYTMIKIQHARYVKGNDIVESVDIPKWLPFHGYSTSPFQPVIQPAVLTLIFTDGFWNLPHSMFDLS